MNKESLFAIEVSCWALAALFSIAGAFLKMLDAWQNEDNRSTTRAWYRHKWKKIRDSRLQQIPRTGIEWLVHSISRLTSCIYRWVTRLPKPVYLLVLGGFFAILIGGMGILHGWPVVSFFVVFVFGLPLFGWYCKHEQVAYGTLFYISFLLCSGVTVVLAFVSLVNGFDSLSKAQAVVASLTIFPALAFGMGLYLDFLYNPSDPAELRIGALVGVSVAPSLSLSLCALTIGEIVVSSAPEPWTTQLLASNAVCDGLTMLATILILRNAVGEKPRFPIPVAIVMDIVVAAGLACASLYFGLVRTESALLVTQVGCVLIGQSPDGNCVHLGAYFWVMHTTFLPTLAFLTVILVCWTGKMVTIPVARAFQLLSVVEKPHNASAFTLLFVAAIFTASAKAFGYWKSVIGEAVS